MEQIPKPHHRENIQKLLDEAHEEGLHDNKMDDTVRILKKEGLLDTFEGGVHHLAIRPLAKEEALNEYHDSRCGKSKIWIDLEESIPYTVPGLADLDVMTLNFGESGKSRESNKVLFEMEKLNVRPITYEELIQYGIKNPHHQRKNNLVALGTKYVFEGVAHYPVLGSSGGVSTLDIGYDWNDWDRFLVVCK